MTTVKIDRYCLCGAALHVKSNPAGVALDLDRRFDELHNGNGCGPATPGQAAAARRREDRAERLKWERGAS